MEGTNGEHNEQNERPEEPQQRGEGSFEHSGERPMSGEPDIPLSPSDIDPLSAEPQWIEVNEAGEIIETPQDASEGMGGEADPRYTGANLSPAELYGFSSHLSWAMDEQIHAVVQPESNDIENPPEPIDPSQPLSVEQFSPAATFEESSEAARTMRERAMRTYVQRPEAIQRNLISADTVTTDFAYDWGTFAEYGDNEQGYLDCQYAALSNTYVTFSDPSGSERASYEYYIHDMPAENVTVLRRRPLALSEVTDELMGSLPQAEVMQIAREDQQATPDIGVEAIAVDPEIQAALEEADRRNDPLVGREEIAFLNSRLAASNPRPMRASGSEFTSLIANREASPFRPTPLQAAWAARELEAVAVDLQNLHPDGVTHQRGDTRIDVHARSADPESDAFIRVVRRRPLTAAEASEIVDDLLPGEADEPRYVYRLNSEVSASRGGQVGVNVSEAVIDTYTGRPVHGGVTRYSHGDIAEVHAIQTIAINPE